LLEVTDVWFSPNACWDWSAMTLKYQRAFFPLQSKLSFAHPRERLGSKHWRLTSAPAHGMQRMEYSFLAISPVKLHLSCGLDV